MLGQRLIQEGVIRVEKSQHGSIVLKRIGEKADRLFVHRPAQRRKFGEMALALFIEGFKIVDVQPGAGKFRGQTARARVADHPPGLGGQDGRFAQLALRGQAPQFRIRRG